MADTTITLRFNDEEMAAVARDLGAFLKDVAPVLKTDQGRQILEMFAKVGGGPAPEPRPIAHAWPPRTRFGVAVRLESLSQDIHDDVWSEWAESMRPPDRTDTHENGGHPILLAYYEPKGRAHALALALWRFALKQQKRLGVDSAAGTNLGGTLGDGEAFRIDVLLVETYHHLKAWDPT